MSARGSDPATLDQSADDRPGALGYVLKGADSEDIIRAIAAAAHGNAIFGPEVARRALACPIAPRRNGPTFPQLTRCEHEVVELIASGLVLLRVRSRLWTFSAVQNLAPQLHGQISGAAPSGLPAATALFDLHQTHERLDSGPEHTGPATPPSPIFG